jgi:hypothetical protein
MLLKGDEGGAHLVKKRKMKLVDMEVQNVEFFRDVEHQHVIGDWVAERGALFRFVCTPLIFQRSNSALVASACARVVTRATRRQTRLLDPRREGGRASGLFIKRRSWD